MRYLSFWAWLGLLITFHITTAHADEKARILLRQAEAKLTKANSLQVEVVSPDNPEEGAATIRVLRPHFFAMIGSGQRGSRTVFMGDEQQILNYDEKARSGNFLDKGFLYEIGNVSPVFFLLSSFLEPELLRQVEQPLYAGTTKRNGRTYRVIKSPATESRGAWILYLGPTGLLEGIESEAIHSKGTVTIAERIWLRNLQLNAPLKPSQFTYKPPKDVKITPSDDPAMQLPPLDTMAPPFTMPGVSGETFTLESLLAGKKALLLNITFRECGACILEIPGLKHLYADLKDKGFGLLAVNIADSRETALKFIQKYNIPYPMGLDSKEGGGMENVETRYHADNGGLNILIGSDGRILWRSTGLNEKHLRCVLEHVGIPALPR